MSTLIVSCEHAGNEVPTAYAHLFTNNAELTTHRGWDPGAREVAEYLSKKTNAPIFTFKITRLLIEVNRSLNNRELFSEFSNGMSRQYKQELIDSYYIPYRSGVEAAIEKSHKPVIHLSIHSFTPVLHDVTRTTEIGVLFDPSRKRESEVSKLLMMRLNSEVSNLVLDFNKPYAGVDDGFTTYLRTKFNEADYAGIEIEINQKFVGTEVLLTIQEALTHAILEIQQFNQS